MTPWWALPALLVLVLGGVVFMAFRRVAAELAALTTELDEAAELVSTLKQTVGKWRDLRREAGRRFFATPSK